MMFIDWQITRLDALTGLYYLNGMTESFPAEIFHPVFSSSLGHLTLLFFNFLLP